MELLEISESQAMSREQAAQRLRELADALSRHNSVEFMRHGMKLQVRVPDEVELELELEIENGESSIEVEISW